MCRTSNTYGRSLLSCYKKHFENGSSQSTHVVVATAPLLPSFLYVAIHRQSFGKNAAVNVHKTEMLALQRNICTKRIILFVSIYLYNFPVSLLNNTLLLCIGINRNTYYTHALHHITNCIHALHPFTHCTRALHDIIQYTHALHHVTHHTIHPQTTSHDSTFYKLVKD